MLCALIMAGGKGTRFWPLSTEEKPKQFLKLIDDETMLQKTVNRVNSLIDIDKIFVCTVERYIDLVKKQLPQLPERNIIVEPEGRNTAPCIALSALVINRYYNDATMIVLPSDHLIRKEADFCNIIGKSAEFLNDYQDSIITFGMAPDRAETGYGYIEVGDIEHSSGEFKVLDVKRFVEKPNKEKAEEYFKSGNFLWNGGIFMWKVEGILDKIKKYMPKTFEALIELENISEVDLYKFVNENYCKTEAISVDYGILEKSNEIFSVPVDIGWDDIGSWEAMSRYRKKDEYGNILVGDIKNLGGQNNIIVSNTKKIIIEGLNNIYVLENEDSIIVGSKDNIGNLVDIRQKRC